MGVRLCVWSCMEHSFSLPSHSFSCVLVDGGTNWPAAIKTYIRLIDRQYDCLLKSISSFVQFVHLSALCLQFFPLKCCSVPCKQKEMTRRKTIDSIFGVKNL